VTLVRPPRLQAGLTIGVVAPSSAPRDDRLEKGLAAIGGRGYRFVAGTHLYDRHGYLAGADAGRAADINGMFARPDVDAVFCARGGCAAWRLMDLIDWELVRAHPKPFVGYSDITTLHLGMERCADLATIHGPMVVSIGGGLSESAADCLWRLLEQPEPLGALNTSSAKPPVRTLVSGRAAGRLAGGCLSLLASAAGTPYGPDFADRIVVLEDVDDPAYRVDRNLHQLVRACNLGMAAGIVVGTATGWDKDCAEAPAITLDDLWRDILLPLGKPTVLDFPFGHVPNPLSIPLGCMAELDATSRTLTVTEAAVV
jgi:muramoyltetrapeptide carboxypeptidase